MTKFHILLERDVGLFSLVQQIISHIPWAQKEGRVPVACFGRDVVYWSDNGYRGADNVWEYYFEPLVKPFSLDRVPADLVADARRPFQRGEIVRELRDGSIATPHFGDHKSMKGKTIAIPFKWLDPSRRLRRQTAPIIREFIRPRGYITEAVEGFRHQYFGSGRVIGVHARGTDAPLRKWQRKGSLVRDNFARKVDAILGKMGDAKIFIATDEEAMVDFFRDRYGPRVAAYPALRHKEGDPVGFGPTGKVVPAYLTATPEAAAQNGAEAVIEYLLLTKCDCLVHNGSGFARTVLLAEPEMPHFNVHLENTSYATMLSGAVVAKLPNLSRVFR
ncbi:MAG: hypothetical protein WDM84_04260 [Bauldia sp.]